MIKLPNDQITPYYMSPEQIEEVKYNEKGDIWSLGNLIIVLIFIF